MTSIVARDKRAPAAFSECLQIHKLTTGNRFRHFEVSTDFLEILDLLSIYVTLAVRQAQCLVALSNLQFHVQCLQCSTLPISREFRLARVMPDGGVLILFSYLHYNHEILIRLIKLNFDKITLYDSEYISSNFRYEGSRNLYRSCDWQSKKEASLEFRSRPTKFASRVKCWIHFGAKLSIERIHWGLDTFGAGKYIDFSTDCLMQNARGKEIKWEGSEKNFLEILQLKEYIFNTSWYIDGYNFV